MSEGPKPETRKHEESRRGFIRGSSLLLAGAIPGGGALAKAKTDTHCALSGASHSQPVLVQPSKELKIGLVGCGYRGIYLATQALQAAHELGVFERVSLTAVADIFGDRLQQALRSLKGKHAEQVAIDSQSRCVGFDGFRRLLETDVDVVLLATPPVFRPQHFEAAVAAGKHVYAEKPIAVDSPGVRRFVMASQQAALQGLAVSVGLGHGQAAAHAETIHELRGGAIGQLIFARAYHDTLRTKPLPRRKSQSELEFHLRNWQHFRWTSGDGIVEQHVQNLDVINGLLDLHPLWAQGTGATNEDFISSFGDVREHYSLEFTYPGGLKLLSMCRQKFAEVSKSRANLNSSSQGLWAHGSQGWCDISGGRIYNLRNELVWQAHSARRPAIHCHGLSELLSSVAEGSSRSNARHAACSTLTAILGRMAASSGERVTWQECQHDTNSLFDVDSLA